MPFRGTYEGSVLVFKVHGKGLLACVSSFQAIYMFLTSRFFGASVSLNKNPKPSFLDVEALKVLLGSATLFGAYLSFWVFSFESRAWGYRVQMPPYTQNPARTPLKPFPKNPKPGA